MTTGTDVGGRDATAPDPRTDGDARATGKPDALGRLTAWSALVALFLALGIQRTAGHALGLGLALHLWSQGRLDQPLDAAGAFQSLSSTDWLLVFAITLVGWTVALGLLPGTARALVRQLAPAGLLRRRVLAGVGLGLAAMAGLWWLEDLITRYLRPERQEVLAALDTVRVTATSAWVLAGFMIVGTVLVPILEEMVFRGLLYTGLRRRLGSVWAALVSTAIFGFLHYPPAGAAVAVGLLGLIFTWSYERTGSLHAPVLLHMVNNLLAFGMTVLGR